MLKFLFFIMIELFYIVVFVQSIGVPNWNMQRCGKDCIVLSTPLSFFGSKCLFFQVGVANFPEIFPHL